MSACSSEKQAAQRMPTAKPPFTYGDLKRAIPPHCFHRSLPRSLAYLAADLTAVALLFYCTRFLSDRPSALGWLLWSLYWIAQGCVATGVWVIAHECGHRAFSDYEWVDNAIGLAAHSLLLVPFFSWKFSHRRHHANNGSMERDEVFVPKQQQDLGWYTPLLQHTPGRLISITFMLIAGWPLYLICNVSGRKYDRIASHFDPQAPIFNKRERAQVAVSDAAVAAVAAGIVAIAASSGWGWVLRVYGVPLAVVNAWLVLITYLQHTHAALPHYSGRRWEWLRGELVTVDRDYGPLLNAMFHHIGDTHVAHHLFSTIPHYHALEATAALRPLLGPYYLADPTPIPAALWREFRECVYVAPDDDELDQQQQQQDDDRGQKQDCSRSEQVNKQEREREEEEEEEEGKGGILWYKNKFV